VRVEHWDDIGSLFVYALKLDQSRREFFLKTLSGQQATLRDQVEALLDSYEGDPEFIEEPALLKLGDLITEQVFEPGERIGHYEVISFLSKGGMSEVYTARDKRLGRTVVLKILSTHNISDTTSLLRFRSEAQTASALNHPNIVTVHEVFEKQSRLIIVTEYVEGRTLREIIHSSSLSFQSILNISIQLLSALSAAHDSGIIHRDIKPENIMVRQDQLLKVLDFGVAKLKQRESVDAARTEPGVILGTVLYMSPEQARGLTVDERTDLWSFGVVLYEMLTGLLPFQGNTTSDTLASILKDNIDFTTVSSRYPPKLVKILKRSLSKDPANRYGSTKEVLHDLLELQQEAGGSGLRSLSLTFTRLSDRVWHLPETFFAIPKFRWVLLLLLAATLVYSYKAFLPERSNSFNSMKITKLTGTGRAKKAAISPDGRLVGYILDHNGKQSLLIRDLTDSKTREIVSPSEVDYVGLTFSIQSSDLYFTRYESKNPVGTLYRVPVGGGEAQKLVNHIDSPISFSSDAKRFAFVRIHSSGETSLVMYDLQSRRETKIASRQLPRSFGLPVWSPTEDRIVVTDGSYEGGLHTDLTEIDIKTADQKFLQRDKYETINSLAWSGDGKGLILAGEAKEAHSSQLWFMTYPEGEVSKITNDLNNYRGASLSQQTESIITVQLEQFAAIWVIDEDDLAQGRQITPGKYDGFFGLSWGPGNQILYQSLESGNYDIWATDSNGDSPKQLTLNERRDYWPVMTPDGQSIVFASNRSGSFNIWRMDSDRKNLQRLTEQNELFPEISPDGNWVLYTSYFSSKPAIWKVPLAGGVPEQLTSEYAENASISPDGRLIACFHLTGGKDQHWTIAILPFEGGRFLRVIDIPLEVTRNAGLSWSSDGRRINYVLTRNGVSNIWTIPVSGGAPSQLSNLGSGLIFAHNVSMDGKKIALSRGSKTNDVVLLRNFR
jgi:eukaryotic-like serine/threonine-protein kinase